jgi:hypothetical protein
MKPPIGGAVGHGQQARRSRRKRLRQRLAAGAVDTRRRDELARMLLASEVRPVKPERPGPGGLVLTR